MRRKAPVKISRGRPVAAPVRWQPIDTAAIDGRDVVVLWGSRPYGDLGVANWSSSARAWLQYGTPLFNVTHWLDADPRPKRTIPPIGGKGL